MGIGFEYGAPPVKNSSKGKSHSSDVPHVLNSVEKPLFKETTVDFSEEALLIKQQLFEEDQKLKGEQMTDVEPKDKVANHKPTTSPIFETTHDTAKSKK